MSVFDHIVRHLLPYLFLRPGLLAGTGKAQQKAAQPAALDLLTGDDAKSASELSSASRQLPEGTPSAAAFTAVTQLLEACVANLDMPQLQDIVQASLQLWAEMFTRCLL